MLFQISKIVLACLLLTAITTIALSKAQGKPFWLDESNELKNACVQEPLRLIVDGAGGGQSSPHPLYYILQSYLLNDFQNWNSAYVLIWTRALSLVSGFALTLLLLVCLWNLFGFTPGIIAVSALASREIYYNYAAENRPYLLWVFLLTAWILVCAHLISIKQITKPQHWGILLLGAINGVALSMVAAAGLVQVGVMLAVAAPLLLAPYFFRQRPNPSQLLRWSVVLLPGLIVGAAYFGRTGGYADSGIYDLINTGNWGLLRAVVRLLFAANSPWSICESIVVLLGILYPLYFWRRLFAAIKCLLQGGSDISSTTKLSHVDCLWIAAAAQLFAFIILAIGVALRHYYFVERVFLYLIVLRALFATIGFILIEERIRAFLPTMKYFRGAAGTIVMFAVAWNLQQLFVQQSNIASAQTNTAIPVSALPNCDEIGSNNIFYSNIGAAANDLNQIARLGVYLQECSADTKFELGTKKFLLGQKPAEPMQAFHGELDPAAGAQIHVCGRPVFIGR